MALKRQTGYVYISAFKVTTTVVHIIQNEYDKVAWLVYNGNCVVLFKRLLKWKEPFITIDRSNYVITKVKAILDSGDKCLLTLPFDLVLIQI